MTAGRESPSTDRSVTAIPAGSDYRCTKCGCIGGRFCVDWSLHEFERPQRVLVKVRP